MFVITSKPHRLHVAAWRLDYFHWFLFPGVTQEGARDTGFLPGQALFWSTVGLWHPDLKRPVDDLQNSVPDLLIVWLTRQPFHIGLMLKAHFIHQTASQLAYGIGTVVKANAECEAESDVTRVPMTTGSSDVAAFR